MSPFIPLFQLFLFHYPHFVYLISSFFLQRWKKLKSNKNKRAINFQHSLMLTLNRLYGIHHHRHSTFRKCLKALLGVDVHSREPTTKARVRVVPANHHLWSPNLLQHIQHLGLKHRVHCLHRHTLHKERRTEYKRWKCELSLPLSDDAILNALTLFSGLTVPLCGIAKTSMTLTV